MAFFCAASSHYVDLCNVYLFLFMTFSLHDHVVNYNVCLFVVTQICKLLWRRSDEQDCRSSGIFNVLGCQCYNGQHLFICWNWGTLSPVCHLFML